MMVESDWSEIVEASFLQLDKEYQRFILKNSGYFPTLPHIFNAFKTLPISQTRYLLFGQDPYPRPESAIGYAFIDGNVKQIFSEKGLSKEVNRAVSLRNFIKMALVADGRLSILDTSQQAIKEIEKRDLIKTIFDLRENFERNGILLLNRALIFTKKEESRRHLAMWLPFIQHLLHCLQKRDIEIILFGNAAKEIEKMEVIKRFQIHNFEHPYNLSFISNQNVLNFFAPLRLLEKL